MEIRAKYTSSIFDNLEKKIVKFTQMIQWPSTIAIAIMPFVICLDVFLRAFGMAVLGAIEIQDNLLVLNTFSAIAFIQINHSHMGIDLAYNKFTPFFQRACDILVGSLSSGILLLLAYQSYKTFLAKIGFLSPELGLPIEIYYLLSVLGLLFAAIVCVFDFIKTFFLALINKQFLQIIVGISIATLIIYFPFWYRASNIDLSYFALGGVIFLLIFFLLFCKMPIGWVMCTAGAVGLIIVSRSMLSAMSYIGSTPYSAVATNTFVALPMFVLMGTLLLYSGISQDLFDCANKWLGNKPGGLGMATVAGCTGFAAVSGDSMATALTMGSVALPEMNKLKYDKSLSTGALAAGGTLGILIPPSSGFIIYGLVTESSVGRLFLAGIIPGLLLSLLFMGYIYYVAKSDPRRAPAGEKYPTAEKIASLTGILPMLVLFTLVLGGIISGLFSPTEGGGVGAMGAFLFALAKRRLNSKKLLSALKEAGLLSARLMCIMIGVGVLGYFFAATRLPFAIADWITSLPLNRYVIFAIIITVFILLGCMMNVIPMLMLVLPSIFPTVVTLGFDPIWFGVICVMVIEMGQITPPVGVVVFALAGVATDVSMATIFKGIIPFLFIIIFAVILITIFPQLATWLPTLILGPEIL